MDSALTFLYWYPRTSEPYGWFTNKTVSKTFQISLLQRFKMFPVFRFCSPTRGTIDSTNNSSCYTGVKFNAHDPKVRGFQRLHHRQQPRFARLPNQIHLMQKTTLHWRYPEDNQYGPNSLQHSLLSHQEVYL